jgi:hypothetical protein
MDHADLIAWQRSRPHPNHPVFQELESLNDDDCLLINHYHGFVDPRCLPHAPRLVIYTRLGDDCDTASLMDIINSFKNSMVVVITSKLYEQIPHITEKYIIISMPSIYGWYARHLTPMHDDLSQRRFNHKFLSLNNRAQWPRQALAQFLIRHDLLKDFLFSYHCQDRFAQGQRELFDTINLTIGSTWFNQGLDIEDFWQRIPLMIRDDVFSAKSGYEPWQNFLIGHTGYYTDCFASIVTETYIDTNWDPFFTEKTFKPIAYGHPFLVHSSAGALQSLRNLGFETFPEVFDESYDLVESAQIRFERILREIERVAQYDLDELQDMYRKLIPKLRHNQEIFYKKLPQEFLAALDRAQCEITEIKKNLVGHL